MLQCLLSCSPYLVFHLPCPALQHLSQSFRDKFRDRVMREVGIVHSSSAEPLLSRPSQLS